MYVGQCHGTLGPGGLVVPRPRRLGPNFCAELLCRVVNVPT